MCAEERPWIEEVPASVAILTSKKQFNLKGAKLQERPGEVEMHQFLWAGGPKILGISLLILQ